MLLIFYCCTCAIISTSGKSLIIYYILYKAPSRPLNKMILLDQIGLLLTSLGTKIGVIGSLMASTPMHDILGLKACEIFYITTVSHNTLLVVDGMAMALFRLLCVRFQEYLNINVRRLATRMIWIQCVFIGVMLLGFWTAAELYGSNGLYEFCRGYTTKVKNYTLFIVLYMISWNLDTFLIPNNSVEGCPFHDETRRSARRTNSIGSKGVKMLCSFPSSNHFC